MVPDCQECGTCCHSRLSTYVRVTGDDYARLGDMAEAVTSFVGNRCYMRMAEAGHCAALMRENGRFACSLYAQRPAVCRELERGSPACEADRAEKRDRTAKPHPRSLPVVPV